MENKRTPTALRDIKLLVLDVDGVLTDGRLYYDANGEALKVFHVRDGHGLKLLQKTGMHLAVISGRSSQAVTTRCRELGIEHLQQGCDNKRAAFQMLLSRLNLKPMQALCIIDDTTDLELASAAGFAVAVADAHPDVLAAADRTTTQPGGRGAVREVCDWLLKAT